MKALYLPGDVDSVFSDMDACRGPIRMLLELAEEFSARFQEAKRKNLVDFNDLEHFALEILTGGSRITDREQWRMNFRESMKKFS